MEERTIFIKPCPLCGSVAVLYRRRFDGPCCVATVKCTDAECDLMTTRVGEELQEATDKAVNAWNRREAEA